MYFKGSLGHCAHAKISLLDLYSLSSALLDILGQISEI